MSKKIKAGDLFPSNGGGEIRVISYISCVEIKVIFVDSGYETTVNAGQLRKGKVRDRLKPSVCGVGYLGGCTFSSRHSTYALWRSMLVRCYSARQQRLQPTYKDCTVCEEWHNYQVFAKWVQDNYPIDGVKYQLDKDIKVKGNRKYGPDYCTFVSQVENLTESNAKYYKFINPEGDLLNIYNLKEFCKENGLDSSSMYRVALGEYKQYKGWTSILSLV